MPSTTQPLLSWTRHRTSQSSDTTYTRPEIFSTRTQSAPLAQETTTELDNQILITTFGLDNHENEQEENEEEFEDEDDKEESSPSWKKSGSEDSDDFQKPVDFGIDKETSLKIANLGLSIPEQTFLPRNSNTVAYKILANPSLFLFYFNHDCRV